MPTGRPYVFYFNQLLYKLLVVAKCLTEVTEGRERLFWLTVGGCRSSTVEGVVARVVQPG